MKRKTLKITAFIAAIMLIIGLGIFASSLVGNPVSHLLCNKKAKSYLSEKYADTDFILEKVSYSFKDGNYYAYIQSPGSADSYFTLTLDMGGNLKNDSYTDMVVSGENTARRLNQAYRELTDSIFESSAFPFTSEIAFGDLEFVPKAYSQNKDIPPYAIIQEDLELDRLYNIPELGAKAGRLTVYIDDETVSIERAAEIMLELKELMDQGGATFYAIDFVLQHTRSEENAAVSEECVETIQFLYSDIYEEGMIERVKTANDAAMNYYSEADAEKNMQ